MTPSTLAQLPRLVRTVCHLRPSQVGWRLRYLVQRRLEAQAWFRLSDRVSRRIEGLHAAPPQPHDIEFPLPRFGEECRSEEAIALERSNPLALTLSPSRGEGTVDVDRLVDLQSGQLTLLNQRLPFAGGDDWRLLGGRTEHRLWRYHLHDHRWLVDLARSDQATQEIARLVELRRWLLDWMTVCRLGEPGFTHYPWNSYTIAQRLWHWREIAALVPQSFWNHADLPRDRFLHSVAAQAEYLSRHLEWDLRGNHLFKDAVGLASAADLLGSAAPPEWITQAYDIVESQVAEQILPDGMHFERSPMYHIHVLEDLLALLTLLRDDGARHKLWAACRRMAEPLRWMTHPSGAFPLFNDAADRQVSRPAEIEAALRRQGIIPHTVNNDPLLCATGAASVFPIDLNVCHIKEKTLAEPVAHEALMNGPAKYIPSAEAPTGLRHFAAAGLVAWHGASWTVFFDVGEVGPDYQPGHAHADTLTLELSFDGLRLVVDPGTYCYDHDDRRWYDRSTNAHNTVCIDDTNSSEVWHIFRVGRRARPAEVSVIETDGGFTASASHTGYDHLAGSPRHRRRIQLQGDSRLEIHDGIAGAGRHRVEGGFLIAPDWTAKTTEHGWSLRHADKQLKVDLHANQPVETSIVNRPWHPEFGKEVITQRLNWSADVALPFRLQTTWQRG